MADTKISALSAGTAAPGDEIPVNRGGSNFKITAGDILKINGGTITADSPVLNLTQTWNNAAVTFTGLKFNVPTDSSASGSLLMDLQVGGTSQFKVKKNGGIIVPTSGYPVDQNDTTTFSISNSSQAPLTWNGTNLAIGQTNRLGVLFEGNGKRVNLHSDNEFGWRSGTSFTNTFDLILARDAADTLAQRRTTNAQTFRIYNTYTDASNYERGKIEWSSNVLRIGTEKAGTGTARALELQTDGTARLTIGTTGQITTSQSFGTSPLFVANNTSSTLGYSAMFDLFSPNMSNGDIQTTFRFGRSVTTNNAGYISFRYVSSGQANNAVAIAVHQGGEWFFTGGGLLQFSGATSSFPALKRNSAALNVRLADDSADANLTAAALTLSGNLTISTKDIVTDTTTGTKIGTGTTQKLAFWNATPVVQPTTGITAGTFVANTSGISDDTATFDGYTIGQVVAALRQIGVLA